MKNNRIKLIAASVALMSSFHAAAGLGGLNVQSHLGENFSGTIAVTGAEAEALLNGGKAAISNKNLRASVRKSGDSAIVRIHSSKPVQEPVLVFNVGVGSQTREYTAIIDPAGYSSKPNQAAPVAAAPQYNDTPVVEDAPKRRRYAENTVRREAAKPAATQEKSATRTARKNSSTLQYGRRHYVRNGETLLEIASRIRPQGLTVSETIQALVQANPNVFVNQNANMMLAGKVLSIPTRKELLRLAGERSTVPASQTNPQASQTANNQAAADTAAKETAAQEAKQAAMPSENTQPSEATPAAASETNAATGTASAAQAIAASEAAASESTAASEAAVSEAIPDAASQAPVIPSDQATEPSSEEESGMWRWLLIGGAALIAAWLLLKLAGKRKAIDGDDDAREEEIAASPASNEIRLNNLDTSAFDQSLTKSPDAEIIKAAANTSAAAAAVVAATKAAPAADDELDMEDDFDDDIFFTQTEETPPLSKPSDIQFDLSSLEKSQTAIPSGAVTLDKETEARRNVDWDTVESTESVYEPEPENPYVQAKTIPVKEEPIPQPDTQASIETVEKAEPAALLNIAKAEAEAEEEWDFFSEAEEAKPVETKAESIQSEDVKPFGMPSEAQSEDIKPFEMPSEAQSEDIKPFEMPSETPSKSESELEPLDFVMDEEEKAEVEATEEEITPLNAPVVESRSVAEPAPFDISKDEDLAFHDAEDLQTETQVVETADEVIEWNTIDTAPASESNFISESVGMTAPLEAKFELAKMYVEIGDPEAARETLSELLEESDGNILTKAKALLKELDS